MVSHFSKLLLLEEVFTQNRRLEKTGQRQIAIQKAGFVCYCKHACKKVVFVLAAIPPNILQSATSRQNLSWLGGFLRRIFLPTLPFLSLSKLCCRFACMFVLLAVRLFVIRAFPRFFHLVLYVAPPCVGVCLFDSI